MLNLTIQHQLDQKSRDLIVQQVAAIVASQNASLLQKVLSAMSVLDDKISAIKTGVAGLNTSVATVAADVAALKAAPAEPTVDQLAALDEAASGLAAAKSSLDAIFAPAGDQVVEPVPSTQPAPAE
jgi:hypothetical protein